MRIALIGTFYNPTIGGVEKVIEELATRYIKQGHEVHVFCSDSDKNQRIKVKSEIINGVHVHRSRYWLKLSLNTYIFPGVIWDLLWQKYDIVHTHVSAKDYVLFAGLIAFLKKRKHVHTTHCPWTDKFRPFSVRIPLFFTNNFFNYISFFFCDQIIAITPWEVPILKKWASERKIKVIRNGMDPVLFEKIEKNNFRKNLGIKGKLVLFFGRLHPTKAPHVFVGVAKEILKERKDIDFVIAGPDEGEMENVKGLSFGENKIHVIGAVYGKKNIAAMYQASDVYVLTSYREGLPLTLFEAMASGLPIVATSCNGVPYEMEDGVNGYLVEYGNVNLFKEKILGLVDDKKLSEKIGLTNRKKVETYTWDMIASETLDLYNS
jgi:glycosyltransferase involved in cell wall biosynthesis